MVEVSGVGQCSLRFRSQSADVLLLDRTGAGDLTHLGELLPWLDEHG